MCDSQVNGCQFAPSKLVNAQWRLLPVIPLHVLVFGDIDLVIEVHEIAAHNRQIHDQRGEREQQGD